MRSFACAMAMFFAVPSDAQDVQFVDVWIKDYTAIAAYLYDQIPDGDQRIVAYDATKSARQHEALCHHVPLGMCEYAPDSQARLVLAGNTYSSLMAGLLARMKG